MSDAVITISQAQAILEKINAATEKLAQASLRLENASKLVETHDNSENSHLYIQELIKAIDSVSMTEVAESIKTHDKAAASHEDIRAEVRAISNSITSSTQIVNNAIQVHDVSNSAHMDIRTIISLIERDMVPMRNNLEYINKLETIFNILGGSTGGTTEDNAFAERFAAIETSIAATGVRIGTNTAAISANNQRDDNQDIAIAAVRSDLSGLGMRVTDVELKLASISTGGGSGGSTGAIDLTTLTVEGLPSIVGHGKQYTMAFKNLKAVEGQTPSFSILAGNSGFQFSKLTEIALDEVITVSIPTGLPYGMMKQFTVTVLHTPSNDVATMSLTVRTNSKPNVDSVICSLPKIIEPGKTYEGAFRGATDIDGQTITYAVDPKDSGLSFSKTTNIAEAEIITMTVPASAVRGQIYSFQVAGTDSMGATSTKMLTDYQVNILPTMTNFSHNVPSLVKPSTTYKLAFSGAVAYNGSACTYGLEVLEAGHPFVISKTTGIVDGENISVVVDSDNPKRGQKFTFRISATDTQNATATRTVFVTVNNLPTTNSVTTTFPVVCNGGEEFNVTIQGGADVEDPTGASLVYHITNGSILSFAKTAGITAGEVIRASAPKVSVDTPCTFTIHVKDAMGEFSAVGKEVSTTIKAVLRTKAPTITYPQDGDKNVPRGFTMQLTPYEAEVVL